MFHAPPLMARLERDNPAPEPHLVTCFLRLSPVSSSLPLRPSLKEPTAAGPAAPSAKGGLAGACPCYHVWNQKYVGSPPATATYCVTSRKWSNLSESAFSLHKMETRPPPALAVIYRAALGNKKSCMGDFSRKRKLIHQASQPSLFVSTLDGNLSEPCYTFLYFLKQKMLKRICLFWMTQGHVGCVCFRYFCLLSSCLGVTVPVFGNPQNPPSLLGCCCRDAVGKETRKLTKPGNNLGKRELENENEKMIDQW